MSEKKSKTAGAEKVKKKSAKEPKTKPPAETAAVASTPVQGPTVNATPASSGSAEFEAGVLFSKYDSSNSGVITANDFRKLISEFSARPPVASSPINPTAGSALAPSTAVVPPAGNSSQAPVAPGPPQTTAGGATAPTQGQPSASNNNVPVNHMSFEAGKVFAQYDRGDGNIDKKAFENILLNHPHLLKNTTPATSETPYNPIPWTTKFDGPARSLTHYDETAGVAIPFSAVPSHQAMGNSVVPLAESYSRRYSQLRTMLTAKLLPKREHLLQLRRQLQITSSEVEAVKKGIETETLADVQQILERLKTVESLRQSAIKHQVIQLDKEIQSMDRIVQRVEAANNINPFSGATTFSGLTIVGSYPAASPVNTLSGHALEGMVELIQQYSELRASIDRLAEKKIDVQVDFPTDDFPKETAERLDIVSKCDKYLHAIAVKDQMLWEALQDKKKCEEKLDQERRLTEEYAKEIADWANMAQQMTAQIHQLKAQNAALEQRVEELDIVLRDNNIIYDIRDAPYLS